ncbi:MAG: hypothetical protein S4CHLAM81_12300 [Chlamydiales bacterium]|nr:hypothetical protein [Chlamydiales bacterium]MCH9636005.1 hypothetical protein [Chlamydiales bacterium]MCH9703924.1 hypothetical protein [Chlamydiota bacterium]
MKVDSLEQFKKQLGKKPKSILILSKELKEREDAIALAADGQPLRFNKESFDPKAFIAEFESTSFLSQTRMIIVEEVDQIHAAAFEKACDHPSSVTLVMAGESMPPKFQEKVELVLKFASKRPYEKEAELAQWMVQQAKDQGVQLAPDVARIWVKSFGMDKALLEQELEKLLCYLGYSGQITLELVREFSITLPHLTLWQLGDALFARSQKEAWQVLHTLLEEGGSIYQILSHLRTQFDSGLRMLEAHKMGRLVDEFPYLKGSMGQKKITLLNRFGPKRLRQGLNYLFETELRAKSESVDAATILEPLLVRLTA